MTTDIREIAIPVESKLPINMDPALRFALVNLFRDLSFGIMNAGLRDIPGVVDATIDEGLRGRADIITAGITIPANVFRKNAVWSVYNNSGSTITLTQGTSLTLRLHGTATTGNRTLAQRGFATLWFLSTTECIALGDVT